MIDRDDWTKVAGEVLRVDDQRTQRDKRGPCGR
jgi:hypothetical protein